MEVKMKILKVITNHIWEIDRNATVDGSTKKLISFRNKTKTLEFQAKEVKGIGFATWNEKGVLTNFDEKIKTHSANATLIPVWAAALSLAGKNEQEYDRLVAKAKEYIKANQEMFFDKYGDFKKHLPRVDWVSILK
jgi:hypothetical protein